MTEQPGGAVDAEHQHAGGHRVEGAGVADLAGAGQPADPGDDVVRRHPGRLVDDDQPGAQSLLVAASGRRRLVVLVDLARLLVRVGVAGVRRAAPRPRPPRPSALAWASTSSRCAGRLRAARRGRTSSVGACRMPSCLATSERIRPLADSSAAAVLPRGSSSLVAEDRVEDRRLLGVAGDPDVGDRDEPEPRVLDPPLEHLGDDHLDPVGDLADAWAGSWLLPHSRLAESAPVLDAPDRLGVGRASRTGS